ncbi:transcriptional regulator [Dietzia sp. SYD-A1]|uniref:transcriptional regulator n=1 Tax=Dietzia sp. SYD-A1 TaxID=2780141 RepID=UPI0018910055|nr:transcriptional regulator [Dietzia sp. SYD-A1]
MAAPQPLFNELIHAPSRLQICAMVAPVEALDFATVREALAVSDSALSKHIRVLADAGYLRTSKTAHASRTRTWITLTDSGREALNAHLAELHRIAAMADCLAGSSE